MKKMHIAIIIMVAIVVAGAIGFNWSSQGNVATKEFTLGATRFQYSPDVITVNKGDLVKIKINNIDTTHGIRIPEFDVSGKDGVEFIASRVGGFDFYCAVYCGDRHGEMKGRLIVN